jgi:hypothetical protein
LENWMMAGDFSSGGFHDGVDRAGVDDVDRRQANSQGTRQQAFKWICCLK